MKNDEVLSSGVTYGSYSILNNKLLINDVQITNENEFNYLMINLTNLQIHNSKGTSLSENIIKFNIYENSNLFTNSQLFKTSYSISSLINKNQYILFRAYVSTAMALTSILSGVMSNFSLTFLIAFAEIIQFLCLFALLPIPDYPFSLNQLYNSQGPFNLNFLPIPQISFFNCSELYNDENLKGNYNNHPSIPGINFACNGIPVLISIAGPICIYLIAQIVFLKLMVKVKKSYQWNGIIQIINGSINVLFIIIFVQISFVNMNRD